MPFSTVTAIPVFPNSCYICWLFLGNLCENVKIRPLIYFVRVRYSVAHSVPNFFCVYICPRARLRSGGVAQPFTGLRQYAASKKGSLYTRLLNRFSEGDMRYKLRDFF